MIPPITEEDHEMSDNPFMTSEELRNLFRCSSTTLWRMRKPQNSLCVGADGKLTHPAD